MGIKALNHGMLLREMPPKLPRRAVSAVAATKPKVAQAAIDLSRIARNFARLEAKYRPGLSYSWTTSFMTVLENVEYVQYKLRAPKTVHERELLAWSKQVMPSKGELARQPWAPIEGLSRRFEWQQVILYSGLVRWAETRIPFDWVTYCRYQNAFTEHADISEAYGDADNPVHRTCYDLIWREIPRSAADRQLILRAQLIRFYNRDVFDLMYRREVRRRERAQGLHLPERQIPKPERLRMFWVNYNSHDPDMKFPISDEGTARLVVRYLPDA